MIVRPKTGWFRMLFAWENSVQNTILAPLAIIFVLSLAALWGYRSSDAFLFALSPVPFSLIGVALAIFASFRNNACYERYWEGRKQWGTLTATTRDLVRFAVTVPGPAGVPTAAADTQAHAGGATQDARQVVALLTAFVQVLKHQLRDSDPAEVLRTLVGETQAREILGLAYRPYGLLALVQRRIVAWHHERRIGDVLLAAALAHIDTLTQAAGACERIRTTPVPYPYEVLLHRTTYFYCVLLPLGLVESVGWATPIIAVFISYAFLALHTIAGELEDPFGQDANDLPLDALAIHIERSMREAVGDTDLRPVPVPDARYRLD
ncbi:Bestrophin [Bordetella sputigena]|uniref:bestrophin family protein n=1 Tax=Bordetella sputigena TaxID=1416810 RepID=UPI0039F023AC